MTTPGTASTSDARKRAAEADQHWTHPDPAVRDLIAQAHQEGIADGLSVVTALLRKVADYWDGRPVEHHGHHIYADLMDVLTAAEADLSLNREKATR